MTIKEQVILKTLINSLRFNDFKPKLTISAISERIMGMESYKVIVSDNNNNKTKPVTYLITVTYYNELAPESTDLLLYSILFN